MAAQRPEAAMRFIMVTVLIDMIAIGIMVPVLPALVGKFTASQSDQAFWYGAVTFSFGLASFFGSPVIGAPVVSGNTLLVATKNGGVFAFRPE